MYLLYFYTSLPPPPFPLLLPFLSPFLSPFLFFSPLFLSPSLPSPLPPLPPCMRTHIIFSSWCVSAAIS